MLPNESSSFIIWQLLTVLVTCGCNQGTSTWWRWATELFHYPTESLSNGCHAVMATTRNNKITRQGFGTPESCIYMYFFGFLHPVFYILTFKWPWIGYDGGQRASDSKLATPKTYVCIFLDFFIGFFAVWPSNDLEFDMMEVNGPWIRNQRPQKPIYVFFWIFCIGFFPKNTA